ncbi:uncharacterized protein BJ212DRAFT_1475760 [Suillus subaureus]|uniref:Uncharacterized protein n=1 Tax=Suillus subaureus TaxID=48587 RepID=A0A9P7JIF6_9AGAM|nr:uncharacterized protein BJ212DRAFT_1475760 [Suillus subaureus]KAG1824458.1 hypothetical protein BJ212DRAFT_1475760 [Suillus subaureus]
MHTRDEPGINLDTVCNLENTFTFEPPLAIQNNNSDDLLTGLEDISVDEINAEFDALEKQNVVERFKDVDIDGLKILEGNVYNFDKLAQVEAGMVPKSINEEFSVINHGVTIHPALLFYLEHPLLKTSNLKSSEQYFKSEALPLS